MKNHHADAPASDAKAAALPVWLLLTLFASFACMIAAACVAGYALYALPEIPEPPPATGASPTAGDSLKDIDAELAEYRRLVEDMEREVAEREARFLLSQAAPGVRVAAIQFASEFGNVAGNRERLTALIRLAAGNGARIIVTPECAIPGYMAVDHQTAWRDPVRRPNPKDGRSIVEAGVADTVPGENTRLFGGLARELNVYLVVTLIERVERAEGAGKGEDAPSIDYFNSAVLLGPGGDICCHYRKLNLWPPGDATWAQPGDRGLGLCDTTFGKLGLLICYDLSSGVVEKLKAAGATMVLYPVGWVHPKPPDDWFGRMLPEKVKDWGLPLIAANWSVDELLKAGEACGYGYSSIYGADGAVLAGAGPDGTEVIYAELPAVLPESRP